MKRLLFAAALLLSACVEFVAIDNPDSLSPGLAVASVSVHLQQPLDRADTMWVSGWVGVAAPKLRFTDDSLRVQGVALSPRPGSQGIDLVYDTILMAGPEVTGAGAVGVTLPVVEGVQFVPPVFQLPVWVRSGPARLVVREGTDLAFSLAPGPVSPELGAREYAQWDLTLTRGMSHLRLSSSGPVPARVVVPAASVPADTARLITAELTSTHTFRRGTRSDSTLVVVRSHSRVEWSVQLVP